LGLRSPGNPPAFLKEIIMRNLKSTELQHVYGGGNTSGGSGKSDSKCKSHSMGKSDSKGKSHSKGKSRSCTY
jgi:hypothetical protein